MIIKQHGELILFGVTQLGKDKIFLGYAWLNKHNPIINWKEQTLEFSQCPDICKPGDGVKGESLDKDEDDEEEGIMMRKITGVIDEWEEGDCLMYMDEEVWICAHESMATKLAIEAKTGKE